MLLQLRPELIDDSLMPATLGTNKTKCCSFDTRQNKMGMIGHDSKGDHKGAGVIEQALRPKRLERSIAQLPRLIPSSRLKKGSFIHPLIQPSNNSKGHLQWKLINGLVAGIPHLGDLSCRRINVLSEQSARTESAQITNSKNFVSAGYRTETSFEMNNYRTVQYHTVCRTNEKGGDKLRTPRSYNFTL